MFKFVPWENESRRYLFFETCQVQLFKASSVGAGEMAPLLSALAALPEDLGLTPSAQPVAHNSSRRGSAAFFRQRQAMPTHDP